MLVSLLANSLAGSKWKVEATRFLALAPIANAGCPTSPIGHTFHSYLEKHL
jgi:hypothetical protein